jgi:hypothetical protein
MASGDIDVEDSVMVPYTVSASLVALKVEQVPDPRDDLRRRDRHEPATHVLGQRHPCQRGEHATRADDDLHAGRAVLDRLEVAEVAVELVVGVLAHGAGLNTTTSGCAPSATGA